MNHRAFFDRVNRRVYCRFPNQIRRFRTRLGFWPNVAFPTTYAEKILWRKVFDHNPLFRVFCNKLLTRDYSRERLPALKLPELLWRGRTLSEAPDSLFARDLVIKATHSCKRNIFHTAVTPDRIAGLRRELDRTTRAWMRHTYGRQHYQWGYFSPHREILAEERIASTGPHGLMDISVRCANGRALLASVSRRNSDGEDESAYFDIDRRRSVFNGPEPVLWGTLPGNFELPSYFPEIVKSAVGLSVGVDYARFDFLCNQTDFFGGEITVYPGAGIKSDKTSPGLEEKYLSPFWDLRESWFLNHPQRHWRGQYAERLREEIGRRF